jgi:hypothetical protein
VGVQGILARASLRRSAWGLLGIVAVLALGLGAAVTAVEAADRTLSAYPHYVERNDVADLVVNPVLANPRTQEIMESTPGVRRAVSDSLLTGAPVGSEDDEGAFLQFRVSQDGRYVDQDRPIVRDGRMIRSGNEVFLSVPAAAELEAEVGEIVEIGFFGVNPDDPTGVELGPMVRQVDLTVVGIGTFADGVLPDELFPRQYALVTPEAAGSADCLQAQFGPDDPRDPEELLLASVPPDCAMTYRYWSLDLEGGQAAAPEVAAELGRRFQEENGNLPPSLSAAGVGYFLIPTFTAADQRSIREALGPAVTSLWVFGVVAGLTAVGAALVLLVRQLRRRDAELAVWRGLGLGRAARAVAIGIAPGAAAALGIAGAVVVALVASPVGPVASARTVVPHPGRSLGAVALLATLVGLALVMAGVAVAAWRRALHADGRGERVTTMARWSAPATASPFVALGLAAATRGRDAAMAAAGVGVAVAAVTATLLYGTAIGDLVDQPDRYGWTFDEAVFANYGYGPIQLDAVEEDLDRPDVTGWGTAYVSGDLTIDGETVPALAGREGFDRLLADLPVVEGRLPSGGAEVAVGASTAEDLSLAVGDEVAVASPFGERNATVTGLVVLPDIGPFQSDRTSLATGALVPEDLLLDVFAGTQEDAGVPAADYLDSQSAIVLMDAAEGADLDALAADIDEALPRWDPTGFGVAYTEPVRPPTIIDLAAVRGLPSALAGLFALAMAGAVVAGLASCFRARRVELAVVRALGAVRRQRRASLRIQALATAVLGMVVGLPVGVVLARSAFRRLVDDIGVVDDVTMAVGLVAVIGLAAVAASLVAAEVLARLTVPSRPPPAAD